MINDMISFLIKAITIIVMVLFILPPLTRAVVEIYFDERKKQG